MAYVHGLEFIHRDLKSDNLLIFTNKLIKIADFDLWKQVIVGNPSLDDWVRKPNLLSFHIASRLPMSETTKQGPLEIDGVSYRLQREIQLLKGFDLVRCKNCRTLIPKRSDMVVMSSDGPVNVYVNPHGFVHELITVYNAIELALVGSAVKAHNWFPDTMQVIQELFAVATRFASTSVVKSSSSGFFSWLAGEKSTQLPPLDLPLPLVTIPPPLPDYVEPGKTRVTTLPNGVKIASETSTSSVASIGLYVDCSSIYETPISSGASHLLEWLAFKSTTNRSHLRVVREVEAIGGNITASATREQMCYTYDALKTYMPEMLEVLVDCVRNPVFLDWEVNEQLQKVKAELGEISNNPEGLILEAIHSVGFSGALANPLMAPESAINRLNATILEEFVATNYTAPRMVLAASGVDHEELVSIAEPLISDIPQVPQSEEPKSVYVGGDYRRQADSSSTHVALAFEVPGGWHQEKDAMTVTVLQMLMGGGGSFSAGGPGKGMYSRLYIRVLNEFQQIQSFSAFNSIYNNTGLFGIYATTGSDFVGEAVDLAVRELHLIADPGQVHQKQLDRAKATSKSAILMNLESRMVASEDIGRQILTYGERKPVEHYLKIIDEISLEDIATISEKIISSPLTMASWGDVVHVPTYDSVSRKFSSK